MIVGLVYHANLLPLILILDPATQISESEKEDERKNDKSVPADNKSPVAVGFHNPAFHEESSNAAVVLGLLII